MHRSKTDEPLSKPTRLGLDEAEEAITLGQGSSPRTELGRRLLAARREFFAAEGRFLNRDELARELAERRGGSDAVGEE